MATVYKTPGVFVEEIPKLPPSVAQVETAIPAFIGVTEYAKDPALGDLHNKPVRIGSLVEYELYFGGGPSPVVGRVDLDSNNNFVSATVTSKFYLYDSVRLFYANGGGDCYIVSIAVYPTVATALNFTDGIATLEKEDEPTILLFPDAVTLNEDDLSKVQVAALTQCNNMQDRVAVFDLREADPKGTSFRDKIGVNYLKYGAAYTPWLKVNLLKTVKYPDVINVIYRAGVKITTLSIFAKPTDTDVLKLIDEIGQAYADSAFVTSQTATLSPDASDLLGQWDKLYTDFRAANNDGTLGALFNLTYNIAGKVNTYAYGTAPNVLTLPVFNTGVTNAIGTTFDPLLAQIVALNKEADADIASYAAADITTIITIAHWNQTNAANGAAVPVPGSIDAGTDEERRTIAVNLLKPLFLQLNLAYQSVVVNSAASYIDTREKALVLSLPVYKAIVTGVANSMSSMPPSGAVVGVYAATDRTRGVWKAPANVSLANVIGPETTFTASELDALNVDAVSGKSINAIRAFTGKGTLIFGARTLAGNDNEWRYISVRRFFNMVEESTKKATEPFVFEPNDANTWVRVQGMIENFLTTLWRQGALQGAKPEHAFYVAVGLGKTMTALDILEGRMIIEIGMAVVRPAEFIILRFSHKMAES
jgi:phage tail sheath protein FI